MRSCEVLAMVLAGGEGKRLLPLTLRRRKPAVAFAGSLRLIDFTLFNCFASGLVNIHVLTQYRAHPLERHISDRWAPIALEEGRALSCRRSSGSYSGTADAVFQNLSVVERSGAEAVLILSADHVYRADYRRLIDLHLESGADITVLTDRVPAAQASRYGVLSCDASGRMREFVEKPSPVCRSPDGGLLNVNLGVYCFSRKAASDLLRANAMEASHDFGRDILPGAVKSMLVTACPLDRAAVDSRVYWRDVGTLESYFAASLELLCDPPGFELEDSRWREDSPFHDWLPTRFPNATGGSVTSLENSNLIGRGARLESADLVDCIVSPGARVGRQARLERCILLPDAVVGPGARLSHVIVDEGGHVPAWIALGRPGRFSGAEGITIVTGRGETWTFPLRPACRENRGLARSPGAP